VKGCQCLPFGEVDRAPGHADLLDFKRFLSVPDLCILWRVRGARIPGRRQVQGHGRAPDEGRIPAFQHLEMAEVEDSLPFTVLLALPGKPMWGEPPRVEQKTLSCMPAFQRMTDCVHAFKNLLTVLQVAGLA